MFNNRPRIGQELLDVPMGQMIQDMAFSIAEAQLRLDENSMEVAEMMGGLRAVKGEINGEEYVNFEDSRVFFGRERLELGSAVSAYNSTTDQGYRKSIKEGAGSAIEEDVVELDSVNGTSGLATYKTSTPPEDKNNKERVYVVRATTGPPSTPEVWYKADGSADKYIALASKPKTVPVKLTSSATDDDVIYVPQRLSMMELGFAPTFYQFVDTILEVKMAIKFSQEGSSSVDVKSNSKTRSASASFGFNRRGVHARVSRTVTTTQVNASYSQKFTYSAEGSSLLRTKLVPIPPPAILEERIRLQMELAREEGGGDS